MEWHSSVWNGGERRSGRHGGKQPNLDFGYAKSEFLSDIHVGMVSRCRSLALWERSGLEMRGRELEARKALRPSEITRGG